MAAMASFNIYDSLSEINNKLTTIVQQVNARLTDLETTGNQRFTQLDATMADMLLLLQQQPPPPPPVPPLPIVPSVQVETQTLENVVKTATVSVQTEQEADPVTFPLSSQLDFSAMGEETMPEWTEPSRKRVRPSAAAETSVRSSLSEEIVVARGDGSVYGTPSLFTGPGNVVVKVRTRMSTPTPTRVLRSASSVPEFPRSGRFSGQSGNLSSRRPAASMALNKIHALADIEDSNSPNDTHRSSPMSCKRPASVATSRIVATTVSQMPSFQLPIIKLEPGIFTSQLSDAGHKKKVLVVVGGSQADKASLDDLEFYDFRSDKWNTWSSAIMKKSRVAPGVVVCRNELYVIGGFNDSGPLLEIYRSVEKFDPKSKTFDTFGVALLPSPRAAFGVVVVMDDIYVIGGSSGARDALKTVLRYDPDAQSWQTVASMAVGRMRLVTVVLDGLIYAVGGASGSDEQLDVMERYDPAKDRWEMLEPMPGPRDDFSGCVLDGCLFVIGGLKDNFRDNFQKFDPKAGSRGTWSTIVSSSVIEVGAAVVAYRGSVYVVGGRDVRYESLNTVERYNPETNRWRRLKNMSMPRYMAGAAILELE